ncbi:MAG: antibiotic biosynthesis monooxygenase [Deltaproteobacteria bacterium]|nr:antibiotic biosynthesis monooxygenase [Deltaproteobacteria bacterium]
MVRVLIDRKVLEDRISDYQLAVRGVRIRAMDYPGYVSGETLCDADDPRRYVTISTWSNRAAWLAWAASDTRRELMEKLAPLLMQTERVTVLEPS